MNKRDVVGKRIIGIWNERVSGDREYGGPAVICTQIELEDGTRLVAHAYESSDCPIASITSVRDQLEVSEAVSSEAPQKALK
jgi:hypothetical protein